jgi:hypothetical protein
MNTREKERTKFIFSQEFHPQFWICLLTQIIQKSSEFDTQFHEQYQIILLTLTIALKYHKEHLLIFFKSNLEHH